MMRRAGALTAAFAVTVTALVVAASLAAPAPASAGGRTRTALLTLSPAAGDLALAILRFPRSGRRSPSPQTLRVALAGPGGSDYLALASLAHPPRGGARALMLLVNRPSPLLDPLHVRLRARWSATLGALSSTHATDVLRRSALARPAALCGLTRARRPLFASALRALPAGEPALGPFSASAAVAAAYDAACGMPYPLAFRQLVTGSSVGGCGGAASASGALCCPPNARCAPGPEPVPQPAPEPAPPPPSPSPPRCPPCDPRPGYACPLIAQPAICPAVAPASAKRLAPLPAH